MIKIPFRSLILFIIVVFNSGFYYPEDTGEVHYDLTNPDEIIILPEVLHEISGVTVINPTTLACIQDEFGMVFIYDLIRKEIRDQYNFMLDGDYEGIAKAGTSLFILRSDGIVFEMADFKSGDFTLEYYETGIPANDNEGICYDEDHHRLLIACKSKAESGDKEKDNGLIFAFDLETKKICREPAFNFEMKVIKQFAEDHKTDLPVKKNKKGKDPDPVIKFMTSEICIHPFSKELFLLSAEDHLLFIFNMYGKIKHIERLDRQLFNQPEGMCFLENGDLLITNEGQDKIPTLLRFIYRKD